MDNERVKKLEAGFGLLVQRFCEHEIELDAHRAIMTVLGIDHGYSPDRLDSMIGRAREKAAEKFWISLEDRIGPEFAAMMDKRKPPIGE